MLNDQFSIGEKPAQGARSEARNEPRGGSIIADRYQVDKLIARGGMSTVYLAHQTKLNRAVALKVLSPPPAGEEAAAFEQRFRREAQTLAQLDHQNIVVLHDYGETEDGRYYLAMEYIDGPRLSDLLKDGPLGAQHALSLLVQVCAGLRYAHKRGVVHRDLKPSNLLIRQNDDGIEQVKIVDFGLVKLTETDQSITRAGLILGSPHCMAPEQVKGLEIDHRADIYAVGVLLFRMITGQYPFHGTNSAATMIAHLNHPIPTFYSIAPELELPVGLEEVVRRCLAKHPSERYASMRDVIDALGPLMDAPPEGLGVRTMTQSSSILLSGSERAVRAPSPQTALVIAIFGSAAMLAMLAIGIGLVALGGILQNRWSQSVEAPPIVVAPAPAPPTAPPAPVVVAPVATPPIAAPVAAPVAVAAPAPAPEAAARPAPQPMANKPSAAASVRPAPAPRPPEPVAKPSPAPVAPETHTPEGYLGLPDDLIE